MISLSGYFQPLNFVTLSWFIFLFFFFDIVGSYFAKLIFKKEVELLRLINWLIGYGIFIFMWFIVSLFTPYKFLSVILSIVVLLVFSLPSYIKNKTYLPLFRQIWDLKFAILIILPFLPSVFVKASLPPYYADEMAYHFISPGTLNQLSSIKYTGGIYADLPRIQNLFYEISFSLTKTYSVARLFHFTVLATAMIYTFAVLKRNFSFLTGFLFVFLFFSLPQDIVLTSTLGYIDVAAYSFLLMALVSFIDFLFRKSDVSLLLTFIFWAMNLGTKYTGVSSFVSFLFVASLIIFFRNSYKEFFNRKVIFKLIFTFLLFGGYWYVKNFVYYGNPIFPFIFPCPWGSHIEVCPATSSFFGDWTTKINLINTYTIISQLFVRNYVLQGLIFVFPFLALLLKDKKTKAIAIASFAIVLLELLILKFFSGFYIRYHQHMQLYLLLGIVIVLTSKYKNWFISLLSKGILLILVISSLYLYSYTVRHVNSLRFLNWNEINYSIGRINIYDWIDIHFPRMKYTIKFCENPPDGKVIPLARFDPDLIWFDYDGLKRSFITNCEYINPPLDWKDIDGVLKTAKQEKLKFWIASANKCIPDKDVKKRFPYERDDMTEMRKLNNRIVCNSEEIEPYLYYFDYTKVNNEF